MTVPLRRARPRCATIAQALAIALCVAFLAGCHSGAPRAWRLTDVRGHLPDLRFRLLGGTGRTVTAREFRGENVLLYFGYTHCPDACPLTMTHLHRVMIDLGPLATRVRILFVSVDPPRDTPPVVQQYAAAFDPRAVGLTGDMSEIESLAKRYRVAFKRGPALPGGGYEVTHSSAIYVFDTRGRARLIASPADTDADIAHDLRTLIGTEGSG